MGETMGLLSFMRELAGGGSGSAEDELMKQELEQVRALAEEAKRQAASEGDLHGTLLRRHLRFTGSVQGVGFRWTSTNIARTVGATGWVKNEPDGSVSMEVQGIEEQIGAVIDGLDHYYNGKRYLGGFRIAESRLVPLHEKEKRVTSWLTITDRIPDSNWFYVVSALQLIITLATILPLLAASTRRLHDSGSSGYWNFLFLLFFIGTIILWILWFRDSAIGANIYGPATKYNLGMNAPFINNGNIQPIFQNPVVQPGAYPQQYNPEQPQPNFNQVGERINENPEQPINNKEEIPINQNTEKPIDNNEQIELFEKPQKPMDNQEQIQINQNQQQPNIFQGQYIPVAQPNMAPQVNPQGQP